MRYPVILTVFYLITPLAAGADWLTLPSTYTHDVSSGQRVNQFAPIAAPTAPQPTNFKSSGYTHTRSSLAYGQSSDNYHRVEKWGDPVRPYGEWRFPYRPYSTPYPNWGAPFAGLGNVNGLGRGIGRPGNAPAYRGERRAGERAELGEFERPGFGRRDRDDMSGPPIIGDNPLNPYPAGPATPYPVAPYYDGYHPVYQD